MWAVIGIYTGREDNILWRRLPADRNGRIEAAGAKALSERDALPLGHDIIHSVTNPIGRLTGAIHVYDGDFFAVPRKEWDPERLIEQPYDVQKTLQMFEESNRLVVLVLILMMANIAVTHLERRVLVWRA
jgi:predicted metal-dependent enzyme (double-stranded beta helix superfamily)